jgi:hypothetical protein
MHGHACPRQPNGSTVHDFIRIVFCNAHLQLGKRRKHAQPLPAILFFESSVTLAWCSVADEKVVGTFFQRLAKEARRHRCMGTLAPVSRMDRPYVI